MTKEEAIEAIREIKSLIDILGTESTIKPSLLLAIEALEHKPSSEGVKSAEEVLNSKFTMDWPMGMPYMDIYDAMKEYAKQFQLPVISDDEIREWIKNNPNESLFNSAKWMRKLLTNKEY